MFTVFQLVTNLALAIAAVVRLRQVAAIEVASFDLRPFVIATAVVGGKITFSYCQLAFIACYSGLRYENPPTRFTIALEAMTVIVAVLPLIALLFSWHSNAITCLLIASIGIAVSVSNLQSIFSRG